MSGCVSALLLKDTLLDPRQTVTVNRIGADTLKQRMTALPGRSLPDLVNTQSGWLLEANGILHPRGSEYQTQYVIDGLPLTDNRSPAFAPEIAADDAHAMNILTGGYPAEYGRKLGGVIEVVTAGQARRGFHGSVGAAAGSFATKSGDMIGAYGGERTATRASSCLMNMCSRWLSSARIATVTRSPASSPTSTLFRHTCSRISAAWHAICRQIFGRILGRHRSSHSRIVDFESCI